VGWLGVIMFYHVLCFQGRGVRVLCEHPCHGRWENRYLVLVAVQGPPRELLFAGLGRESRARDAVGWATEISVRALTAFS